MYSYYSPNYSPNRTPEDIDYIDSRRKNFSNPKFETKTKVITHRTYLDGEKIKEKEIIIYISQVMEKRKV